MPHLKKQIANWLADMDLSTMDLSNIDRMRRMLVKGNRGYLAWNERELSIYFDKIYDNLKKGDFDNNINQKGCNPEIPTLHWKDKEDAILILKDHFIKRADKIYDIVFEDVFL